MPQLLPNPWLYLHLVTWIPLLLLLLPLILTTTHPCPPSTSYLSKNESMQALPHTTTPPRESKSWKWH